MKLAEDTHMTSCSSKSGGDVIKSYLLDFVARAS